MAFLKQFQAFKSSLSGWAEVSLAEFRALQSMRQKKEWSEGDKKIVLEIATRETTALETLFANTAGAAEFKKLLASHSITVNRQPMPKAELEGHLKELVKNCRRDGWTAQRFRDYLAYLDSPMSVADLGTACLAGKASEIKGEVPRQDLFAEKYREGNTAYKNVVKSFLSKEGIAA